MCTDPEPSAIGPTQQADPSADPADFGPNPPRKPLHHNGFPVDDDDAAGHPPFMD